jgi:ubiquitin C-terminal hydrolase
MSTSDDQPQPQNTRGIIGLANLGNTCYMNSAIQAFRHCPEWTVFCKKGGELETRIRDKTTDPGKIALAYQDLCIALWAGSGPAYVKPMGFYDQLRSVVKGGIYEDFIRKTPQDAHEFLVWLLDQMYMATQREVDIQVRLPPSIDPMIVEAVKGWKSAFEKQYSPLTDLIFGLMRVQYTCGGCNTVHTRWETFNTFKVSLTRYESGVPKSLLECMQDELQEEDIDGYACDACKEKTSTKKKQTIWRLPRVFLVTLKRFTPFGSRDNTPLMYDGSSLCLDKLFSKESQEVTRAKQYSVFATIDHHGHHGGGHYTSQCFNPVWKSWHLYDDETVHAIQKPQFGPQTYMLMFR